MITARRAAVAIVCGALAGGVNGGLLDEIQSINPDEGPWIEESVAALPELPAQSNLVNVRLEGDARHEYFIDSKSLSIGRDGVVRFSFVIKTRGGSMQTSYAGLHCARQEWKTYAIAADAGRWRNVGKPAWELIDKKRSESVRMDLYRHYLCIDRTPVTPSDRILSNLRKGIPPRSVR